MWGSRVEKKRWKGKSFSEVVLGLCDKLYTQEEIEKENE